jgi:hypothetical protein
MFFRIGALAGEAPSAPFKNHPRFSRSHVYIQVHPCSWALVPMRRRRGAAAKLTNVSLSPPLGHVRSRFPGTSRSKGFRIGFAENFLNCVGPDEWA